VVVQADELLGLSTAIVAPTSQAALAASFRPVVAVAGESTRVLVEQLRAVDISALAERVGRLGTAEQTAVDDALGLVLGLL
jgi:mRNA interferase MazF